MVLKGDGAFGAFGVLWIEFDKNGSKRIKMSQNVYKWTEYDNRWIKTNQNRSKWIKTYQNVSKYVKMNING